MPSMLDLLRLPSDLSGMTWSTFRGEREGFSLGPALTEQLINLGAQVVVIQM